MLRPGMHPWHNEDCDMEFRYESNATRAYWCKTHNKWAYEIAKKTYVFEHEQPLGKEQ